MKDAQTALALADQQTAIQPITPMGMLQIAVSQNADLDKLQKLMELQERWEANEARKAFLVAFAEFKSEAVRVVKNVTITDGPLKGKKHVDLHGVVDSATPALSKHGLSLSWKTTKDEPGWIEITCTLRHALGHSDSVSMGGAPDTGPGRNTIQARGSAITYLERYTAMAVLGLAAANDDTDGRAPQKNSLSEEQFLPHQEAIQNARDINELKAAFKRAYTMAVSVDDQKAFTNLYEARKKAMQ